MATLVKQYQEQVPKKLVGGNGNAYPLPCKLLAVEVADQHHHHYHGGGSPNSVIRDHAASGNANYYYSSSSSGSVEHGSFTNSQQQAPAPLHIIDRCIARHGKSKLMPPNYHHHVKQSPSLQKMMESNAAKTMNTTIDLNMVQLNNGQHGPHLTLLDIHNKSVAQPFSLQQQQFVPATRSFAASKPYDPNVNHASKGLPSTSEANDAANYTGTKLPQYQSTSLNCLINTLMQQYQPPSFVVEDGKKTMVQSLSEVLAADGQNGSSGPTKPKLITAKGDEAEKWINTKLKTPSTYIGSSHNVPLLKLSHNDHTFPMASVEQESLSLQPSYNKVQLSSFEFQPCHFQTDADMWDKSLLKNEVEKLTNAVNCAQACLERIQLTPTSRNTTSTTMNPFLAPGMFGNTVLMDPPTMALNALRSNAQVDSLMEKSVLGSAHVPTANTRNAEPFRSPVMVNEHHTSKIGNHHTTNQASQKEIHKLPGALIGSIKPFTKVVDVDSSGDFVKVGEHFRVQMPAKSGQGPSSTNYMKDAFTEITPSVSHRDMGTQMTPWGSSQNSSQPLSPHRGAAISPARHNTPTKVPNSTSTNVGRMNPMEVERCHRAKLELHGLSVGEQVQESFGRSFDSNWSSREEEEEDIGKGLRHLDLEGLKQDVMEARASAWEEATRLKVLDRYEREETKIRAWEDRKAAKAEADLKKLEMKLEKKRMQRSEKIAKKLDAAHRRAEELRAAAKAHRLEAMEKTCDRANQMRQQANYIHDASHPLCSCFTHSHHVD